MAREPDLVVAGGGPAGLATAIAARSHGLDVTVLDPRRPPIDRACGEGLLPQGWSSLQALGVEIPEVSRFPFSGISYLTENQRAHGRFACGFGYGIRRTVLHQAMVMRAQALGVDLRWGVRATAPRMHGLETDAGFLPARTVVIADGRGSRLRSRAGLDGPRGYRQRLGLRQHFHLEPWNDRVEVHWAEGCEAYVTPVAPDLVGVAILFAKGNRRDYSTLLGRFPALMERLEDAEPASALKGAGPFSFRARRVTRNRLALVGDASLCLDPLTGEGLSLAFRQAVALAKSLQSGSLDSYAKAHRRLARGPVRLTRLVLVLTRWPRLRAHVILALARDPALFARFLDTMDKGRPPSPRDLVRLVLAGLHQ